jgi:hypothetical protein
MGGAHSRWFKHHFILWKIVVHFVVRSMDFFQLTKSSSCTVVLESTQPGTEMSTKNLVRFEVFTAVTMKNGVFWRHHSSLRILLGQRVANVYWLQPLWRLFSSGLENVGSLTFHPLTSLHSLLQEYPYLLNTCSHTKSQNKAQAWNISFNWIHFNLFFIHSVDQTHWFWTFHSILYNYRNTIINDYKYKLISIISYHIIYHLFAFRDQS